MVIVLDVGQCFLHMLLVMVIDQHDGARDVFGAEFLPVLDEMIVDHVGDGQRPVVVALAGLKHKAHAGLEHDRRGKLIAGKMLTDGEFRVHVYFHRMNVDFDSRRKHEALVAGI